SFHKYVFQLDLESGDVVPGDCVRGNKNFPGGQLRFVAAKIFTHAQGGLVANPEWLLDDRAVNLAGGNPGQGVAVFIKANDLYLPLLARATDGRKDGRPGVAV